jgi:hypothetical protein
MSTWIEEFFIIISSKFTIQSNTQLLPKPHQPTKFHLITAHHSKFEMSKIITVFGATGAQGGSVIKHLLADATLSQQFKIRGITRDLSKPAAQELEKKGVEMRVVSIFKGLCQ